MLLIDRRQGELYEGRHRRLDRQRWTWTDEVQPEGAEPIDLIGAVRWLQFESGTPWRAPVGLIGPREPAPEQAQLAEQVGTGGRLAAARNRAVPTGAHCVGVEHSGNSGLDGMQGSTLLF